MEKNYLLHIQMFDIFFIFKDVLQKLVAASSLSTKLLVGGYEDRIGVGNPNLPEVVDIVVGSLGTVQKSIKQGDICSYIY